MGFLDKVKAGAGQAKEMAGKAAEKAREEAKELQLKRELNNAYEDLGKATFERLESGELTAPGLAERADKIRSVKAQITALQAGDDSDSGDGSAPTPTGGSSGPV
jgi:hypothetical protein